MELLVTFIIINAINVILSTIKSLCTVKGGKLSASLLNAVAYGFNTVAVISTMSELPIITKALTIGIINFIGVYFVKWLEETIRKDKLWKIEATLPKNSKSEVLIRKFKDADIPFNYVDINKYYLINIYSSTKEESKNIKFYLDKYNAKYFVTESKNF